MEYRYAGSTGLRISQLALGTMSFGGDADEGTARALFEEARSRGVNFFDCADVYQKGRAEEILGRLIRTCRDEVIISSKVASPMGDGPNESGASRYRIVRSVERSLKRLDTDHLDVYFIHRYDAATALEDVLRALDDLVRQGKILYGGLSNFSAWQAQRAIDIARFRGYAVPAFIQPMYSLAKRQAEVEILPMAADNNIAVLSYSPLGGGLLSGKYGVKDKPADGRLSTNSMYQVRYGDAGNYRIAEDFRNLAEQWGYHPVSLAVAWVGSHPAVTAPLLGARSVEQLKPALDSADISLTPEQRREISRLSPAPPPATDRIEEQHRE